MIFRLLIALVVLSISSSGRAYDQLSSYDRHRLDLLERELGLYDQKTFTFDASALSEKEQRFLQHMMRAADLVDEISLLQLHPRNLKYRESVSSRSELEQRIFTRNRGPWCIEIEDPFCNSLPSLPERWIGWHHWPDGMTEATLEILKRDRKSELLLSPFTIVRIDEDGDYIAVPYVSWPLIRDRLHELSLELKRAIPYADSRSLKRFLRSRAGAIVRADPFPYDASDLDWIRLDGNWDITIGPYETHRDPLKQKAMFEMIIAREEKVLNEDLDLLGNLLQSIEQRFAEELGGGLYKARELGKRGSIRAVRVLRAAGDARRPHGATVAFHLPNRGKVIEEGLSKSVLLFNHMELFEPFMQSRAKLALTPKQARLVDGKAAMLNTAFHELVHGIGPYHDYKIPPRDPEGELLERRWKIWKRVTVGETLGTMHNVIEELKADVVSLWLLPWLKGQGFLSEEEVQQRYASALVHMLELLQHSLTATYPRVAVVELGYLMEEKAVHFKDKTKQFEIDFMAMPKAIEKLSREIVRIQLTGNRKAAEELVERYINDREGNFPTLGANLKVPITHIKSAFQRANLKGFSIDYAVSGL